MKVPRNSRFYVEHLRHADVSKLKYGFNRQLAGGHTTIAAFYMLALVRKVGMRCAARMFPTIDIGNLLRIVWLDCTLRY